MLSRRSRKRQYLISLCFIFLGLANRDIISSTKLIENQNAFAIEAKPTLQCSFFFKIMQSLSSVIFTLKQQWIIPKLQGRLLT